MMSGYSNILKLKECDVNLHIISLSIDLYSSITVCILVSMLTTRLAFAMLLSTNIAILIHSLIFELILSNTNSVLF